MVTTSTSLSLVAMVASLSGKIADGFGFEIELLAAIIERMAAVVRRQARIADHLPRDLVAVAAIDRIGEEAFHRESVELLEEHFRIGEVGLAGVHGLKRFIALRGGQAVELLAVGLAGPGIGVGDGGTKEFV